MVTAGSLCGQTLGAVKRMAQRAIQRTAYDSISFVIKVFSASRGAIFRIASRANQRTRCVALICKLVRGRASLSPVNPLLMSELGGGERNVRFLCRAQNTGHSFDLPSAFDHSQWKRGLYRMSDLGLFKTINSCAVKTIDYHLELDAPVQPARHFYGYHKTQELILPK